MNRRKKYSGFTLVELAIVLVIIGLLVGGILAGQTLIKQAKIKKSISELQNLDKGWKTFYLKYNGWPGDLKNPARFFPVCNGTKVGQAADMGGGDGNGKLEGNEGYCGWSQLAISGLYVPIGPKQDHWDIGDPSDDINFSEGDASNVAVWPLDKAKHTFMYYADMNFAKLKSGNYFNISESFPLGAFTPEEMYMIDIKMDDGTPRGNIFATEHSGVGHCFTDPDGGYPWMASATSAFDLPVITKDCDFYYPLN